MRKPSIGLQELRRKIYSKAKTEKHWKFWGLYCHICKKEILKEAYRLAKANGVGHPGSMGRDLRTSRSRGWRDFWKGYGRTW
jgi:RNA-directed DNA polymerase